MKFIQRFIALKMSILRVDAAIIKRKKVKPNLYPSRIIAAEILAEIEKLDIFADVKTGDFEAGVASGSIQYIPDEVYTAFVEQVKSQSVLFGEEVNKDVAIVYSPLNGTGLKPVTRTLKEMGYTNITVVKEQERSDGNFPTCPYPNPEIKEAMALGMEYAKKCNADLLLATDPDCDRVGIAVKNKAGEYELLTGNQTGMLLLDYICSQRVKHGKMPADPVMVKTIVTMDMGEQIASHYDLRTINVLTGFKFIGEQIGKLEKQGKAEHSVLINKKGCSYVFLCPVNHIGGQYKLYVDQRYIGVFKIHDICSILKAWDDYVDLLGCHVHHIMFWKEDDLFYLFSSINTEYLFYLHDYYFICDNYNLLKNNDSFCGGGRPSKNKCSGCIHYDDARKRIAFIDKIFEQCQKKKIMFISPSLYVKKLWIDSFPQFENRTFVIEHLKFDGEKKIKQKQGKELRIAFLSCMCHRYVPSPVPGADPEAVHTSFCNAACMLPSRTHMPDRSCRSRLRL